MNKMMKTAIPNNNVSVDYNKVLDSFVALIKQRQKDNIRSIFLTGSYARGDATDSSDLDVWCVFDYIDSKVLYDVGISAQQLPVLYTQLYFKTFNVSFEIRKILYLRLLSSI
jgi:predicted nucleotidyltransferase